MRKPKMTLETLREFERAVDRAADDLMCTTAEAEAAKRVYREDMAKQAPAPKKARKK